MTYKNQGLLREQIADKNRELDTIQNQLMKAASESSYAVYLMRLEQALERTDSPQITYPERHALKMILSTMYSYNEMERKAQKTQMALTEANAQLQQLRRNLTEKRQQLQHYSSSKPQLIKENQDRAATNNKLIQDRDSAGSVRTNALFFALFGVSTCSLSTGLVAGLMVSPLFFVIPGMLALSTLISLTVAVIYHFKKSGYENQIDENKQTILNNEATLAEQEKKADSINASIIPALNAQISEAEHNSAQIDKQLKEQQHAMSQLSGRAQNITSTYGGNNAFFTGTPDNVVYYPVLPSAPEYDAETLLNYGGQVRG